MNYEEAYKAIKEGRKVILPGLRGELKFDPSTDQIVRIEKGIKFCWFPNESDKARTDYSTSD